MFESRLILFLRKSKPLTQKLRGCKSFSAPCGLSNESSQSRFYSSFPRLAPASATPAASSSTGDGMRSLVQDNCKKICKPSSRNLSTTASGSAKTSKGLNFLVTADPHAQKAVGNWLIASAALLFFTVALVLMVLYDS